MSSVDIQGIICAAGTAIGVIGPCWKCGPEIVKILGTFLKD
jgi:hypothetical protein